MPTHTPTHLISSTPSTLWTALDKRIKRQRRYAVCVCVSKDKSSVLVILPISSVKCHGIAVACKTFIYLVPARGNRFDSQTLLENTATCQSWQDGGCLLKTLYKAKRFSMAAVKLCQSNPFLDGPRCTGQGIVVADSRLPPSTPCRLAHCVNAKGLLIPSRKDWVSRELSTFSLEATGSIVVVCFLHCEWLVIFVMLVFFVLVEDGL